MRKALVTGGANPVGIGFASARALADQGFEVVATGINEAETGLTPRHPGISSLVLIGENRT